MWWQIDSQPGERRIGPRCAAVEKRRQEWLMGRYAAKQAVRLAIARCAIIAGEIEIVPDAYGCPRADGSANPLDRAQPGVRQWRWRHLPNPASVAGIDLESLAHRREDFEAIAFRSGRAAVDCAAAGESRQEWALRMWCAKEAVGKALGRGLSAGLLAFHIIRVGDRYRSRVEIELRDGALEHFPQLRGQSVKSLYTARESNFVFSAIIYQQGAVRMRPSRQEILDYLLQKMGELTQDWDYPDPVGPESLLFTELGFESLDAVVLCTAIQEHYQTPMPFAELLAEIGQQQRDLSINELTDFVDTHLGGSAGAESATRRLQ